MSFGPKTLASHPKYQKRLNF